MLWGWHRAGWTNARAASYHARRGEGSHGSQSSKVVTRRHGARRRSRVSGVWAQQHRDGGAAVLRRVAWRGPVHRQLAEQPVRVHRHSAPPASGRSRRAAGKPFRHDGGGRGVHGAVLAARGLHRALADCRAAPRAGARPGAFPTKRRAVPHLHLPRLLAGKATGHRPVRHHRFAHGGAGDHLPAHRIARLSPVLRSAYPGGRLRHHHRFRAAARPPPERRPPPSPHRIERGRASAAAPCPSPATSTKPAPARKPSAARQWIQRRHELRTNAVRGNARGVRRRHPVRLPEHRRSGGKPCRWVGHRPVRRETLRGLHHRLNGRGIAAHGARAAGGSRAHRSVYMRRRLFRRNRDLGRAAAWQRATGRTRSWLGSRAPSTPA